ncbi:hypothetical protein PSACC_03440 [Paramicrosporidium saccamoebae]|uniref:Uncharacterized protein n=1 Tax=Paramicrosporidium saccamoebae TaxID=1246581 RepID=A0A2H9TG45_9FUNG|nr:hypothetical protein PSACC_03440 [Paramicrosporidium saccamoebae]
MQRAYRRKGELDTEFFAEDPTKEEIQRWERLSESVLSELSELAVVLGYFPEECGPTAGQYQETVIPSERRHQTTTSRSGIENRKERASTSRKRKPREDNNTSRKKPRTDAYGFPSAESEQDDSFDEGVDEFIPPNHNNRATRMNAYNVICPAVRYTIKDYKTDDLLQSIYSTYEQLAELFRNAKTKNDICGPHGIYFDQLYGYYTQYKVVLYDAFPLVAKDLWLSKTR